MQTQQITINSPIYDKTLELRTNVISIPFGFPPPKKETETPDSCMFVAIEDDTVVGFAMITPSDDKKTIRARQISVTPSRQRQGIGRQLMQEAQKKAKELGYSELCLFAHTGSHPFFLKLGFEVKGDWQSHDNGLKTILMSKEL